MAQLERVMIGNKTGYKLDAGTISKIRGVIGGRELPPTLVANVPTGQLLSFAQTGYMVPQTPKSQGLMINYFPNSPFLYK